MTANCDIADTLGKKPFPTSIHATQKDVSYPSIYSKNNSYYYRIEKLQGNERKIIFWWMSDQHNNNTNYPNNMNRMEALHTWVSNNFILMCNTY